MAAGSSDRREGVPEKFREPDRAETQQGGARMQRAFFRKTDR